MTHTSEFELIGISFVENYNTDHTYSIGRSRTVVFPFTLAYADSIRVDATHIAFNNNQQGTILAWASDEPNGRSITGGINSNLSRINLTGNGSSWLFYSLGSDVGNYEPAHITQWIYPDRRYYMCFQNLENKDNSFYVKFTNSIPGCILHA